MLSFLLKFTLVLNSALLFRKLLVFEFLLGISEISHCSMSAPYVKIVPLLDVHQLLILFAGTLTHSEPRKVSLVTFYMLLYFYYINCLGLYFVCKFFVVSFDVFVLAF
jgi:hypothetical protein